MFKVRGWGRGGSMAFWTNCNLENHTSCLIYWFKNTWINLCFTPSDNNGYISKSRDLWFDCSTNNCTCQKSRGMIGYPSSKAVDMLSGPTWRSDIFPSILRSAIQKTSFIREEKWVLFCLYWSFFETSQQTIPSWLIWNFWFVCSVKNTISSEKLFVKSESWFTREED